MLRLSGTEGLAIRLSHRTSERGRQVEVRVTHVLHRTHHGRSGVRTAGLAALMMTALGVLLLAAPAAAQEPERVSGRLVESGDPVAGVTISVAAPDGAPIGAAVSDEDGRWTVELPGPGSFLVAIDVESLPEGVGLRDPDRTTVEVRVNTGGRATALFSLGERVESSIGLSQRLAQNLVNGIKFGLIIAMTAIGLSLIFGTTGLINFAHGDLVAFGALAAYFLNTTVGLHLLIAAPLAIALTALFSGALDRGLWRPLRRRGTGLIAMLVISIGLAFVIRHLLLLYFGGTRRPYQQYALQQSMTFGPIRLGPAELWVMGLSVLVLVGVALLLTRTRTGKSMRAVADNRDLAESSGIDVQRTIQSVWILGGALTATGGIFLGIIESVDYLMGFRLLLLMFAGVILGGLGSAFGAMIGSLVVGIISEVSTVFVSSELKYVWALGVLIVVLLIRPQGILGTKERIG
jgi:branched-chain amino acid transport system permease protein